MIPSHLRRSTLEALRSWLARYPELFLLVQRIRYRRRPRHALLSRDTEIVIEGFPRSGNGWTLRMFRRWQGGKVRVAHHQHSEAHILAGCKRGLPVLVLLRDPADCIRSWRMLENELDTDWALRRWIAFHEAVEGIADGVVIATFDQTTQRLGEVIKRINSKFGTSFLGFDITDAMRERVIASMAPHSRPGPGRAEQLAEVSLELDSRLLDKARALYRRLEAQHMPA